MGTAQSCLVALAKPLSQALSIARLETELELELFLADLRCSAGSPSPCRIKHFSCFFVLSESLQLPVASGEMHSSA